MSKLTYIAPSVSWLQWRHAWHFLCQQLTGESVRCQVCRHAPWRHTARLCTFHQWATTNNIMWCDVKTFINQRFDVDYGNLWRCNGYNWKHQRQKQPIFHLETAANLSLCIFDTFYWMFHVYNVSYFKRRARLCIMYHRISKVRALFLIYYG